MQASDSNHVQIFDTTLRDGEQSPGASMNVEEKVAIARQLEQLNVDVIEAGFAASSEGDYDSVSRVAEAVARPIVLSLSRTKENDIERAIRAVAKAKRPGIHIFIATSDIHLKHKLMMSRQEVVDAAAWAVGFAKKHLDYIEFSAEDASRSDPEYLVTVFGEAIRAGAVTLNVPDTTGYALPHQTSALFRRLIAGTPGGRDARWSAHCHNDLGMAVANSLAAVEAGARQVECTVNGLGERAGNASMDEIVMALRTRKDFFGLETGVVTEQIYAASRLVSQITGIPIPINKPIVGDNAFAHEAGIHQDGVLKNKITYEIMRPETVGVGSNRLVLGKHSGRHAFVDRLQELGIAAQELDMNKAFARFKALADKKKHVYDEDLMAIVAEEAVRARAQASVPDRYELAGLSVASSMDGVPSADVRIRVDGEERAEHATGDGVVDACYAAIAKATGTPYKLERYAVKAITGGTDAQGEVSCLVRDGDLTSTGQGAHTDIIMASALALLNALNKLEYRKRYADRSRVTGP
ncbi:MAG: 2-isopropylmalate synthase [Deltaproteobacteria bacterium]|nr:2-isopropylmalate synthase [Deltaproteobacteria bacterium]